MANPKAAAEAASVIGRAMRLAAKGGGAATGAAFKALITASGAASAQTLAQGGASVGRTALEAGNVAWAGATAADVAAKGAGWAARNTGALRAAGIAARAGSAAARVASPLGWGLLAGEAAYAVADYATDEEAQAAFQDRTLARAEREAQAEARGEARNMWQGGVQGQAVAIEMRRMREAEENARFEVAAPDPAAYMAAREARGGVDTTLDTASQGFVKGVQALDPLNLLAAGATLVAEAGTAYLNDAAKRAAAKPATAPARSAPAGAPGAAGRQTYTKADGTTGSYTASQIAAFEARKRK